MEEDDASFKLFQKIRTGIFIAIVVAFALAFLNGCSTLSGDEMYSQAYQCGSGPECQELWDKWNDYEDKKLEEERRQAPINACNAIKGVWYCDHRSTKSRCQCVGRQAIDDMLRGY